MEIKPIGDHYGIGDPCGPLRLVDQVYHHKHVRMLPTELDVLHADMLACQPPVGFLLLEVASMFFNFEPLGNWA